MTRRRLLQTLLIALAVTAVILPLAAWGLLGSEAGTRWLLHRAAELAEGPTTSVRFRSVGGNLLDEVRFGEVRVRAAGGEVDIGAATLRWRPSALLTGTLHLRALELTRLRFTPPSESAGESGDVPAAMESLPDLVLPLAVQLDRLRIDGLAVAGDGGEQTLRTVAFTAHLDADDWSVRDLIVSGDGLDLAGEARLGPRAPHRVEARLKFSAESAETGQVEARLNLSGNAADYRLQAAVQAGGPGIPPLDMRLQARGDLRGLDLSPLTVDALAGMLTVTGPVRWAPEVTWDLALRADGLNPAVHFSQWPGSLNGHAQAGGRIGQRGPEATVQIAEIEGTLREQPLHVGGTVDYRQGLLAAEALEIVSGPNRLRLDGQAGEQLDLAFDLDAPDLAGLYPGLVGQIVGKGTLAGNPLAPDVIADLDGRDIGYRKHRIGKLRLRADWQERGGTATLHAAGLSGGSYRIDTLDADLGGTPDAHSLELSAGSPTGSMTLQARGGLSDGSWRGDLRQLSIDEPVLGAWSSTAPAALELGGEQVRGGKLCLGQETGEALLCIEGGWSRVNGLDASGRLDGLNLTSLSRRLPGEAEIHGRLAGDFKIFGPPARPTAEVSLRPSDGLVSLATDGESYEITYRNARVAAHLADDRVSAEIALQLGDGGQATGQLTVSEGPARTLGGQVSAGFPDLRLVEGFVPALESVTGRLQLDMGLAGSLEAPRVEGSLRVLDAAGHLPAIGLELEDISIEVRGDGRGPLAVNGGVTSGGGRLILAGTLDPALPGGLAVDLGMKGKDFQVARLPNAEVVITPELRLAGQPPYHLSGRLLVPIARIELEDLPAGRVAVSDDEIVVGEAPPADRTTVHNLTAALRVELGKAVSFRGFGLSTGLTGALDAVTDAQGTRVQGKVELRDASYKAYGQNLKVKQGRLLFAGPPGNPDVDVRAMRESHDGRVKAYLAMSGPLADPRPRIYSEPALPEAEALAYLLTGRGLDQANKQEGADIAAAAMSLGLSRAEPLMQDLGSRLGLDELRIADNGAAGGSLILGKYLNPDLYLGYTQGLFDPQGAALLKLRLTDWLELESRAGTEQSVDLFYRYQHD